MGRICMCLYICDHMKYWLSMFPTKLDELLTNKYSPGGIHSPWPVFTQTCNSGFGRLELLPAKKKNLRFNYNSRVVTLHHCQYHKNPTKSVHYGLTIVYSNLHIASLDLFVYLEILKNKFVNHNMENNGLLIPFSFTIWK